jgi:hypothetical protein
MNNVQTINETISLYTDAWNKTGYDSIIAALRDCWAAEGTYVDTQNPLVKGLVDLTRLIESSYEKMPVRTFKLLSAPVFHNNSGYFKWSVTAGDQTREGMDYFEYNTQHQVTRIVGFF